MGYPQDTDDVRSDYIMGRTDWCLVSDGEAGMEFDDWLSAHDREVRAQAYEWVAADKDKIGGWAIGTLLTDLAAMERGQMTMEDIIKKWRG